MALSEDVAREQPARDTTARQSQEMIASDV
jgi:hypothetical protein